LNNGGKNGGGLRPPALFFGDRNREPVPSLHPSGPRPHRGGDHDRNAQREIAGRFKLNKSSVLRHRRHARGGALITDSREHALAMLRTAAQATEEAVASARREGRTGQVVDAATQLASGRSFSPPGFAPATVRWPSRDSRRLSFDAEPGFPPRRLRGRRPLSCWERPLSASLCLDFLGCKRVVDSLHKRFVVSQVGGHTSIRPLTIRFKVIGRNA
jgi:hypothetical protein